MKRNYLIILLFILSVLPCVSLLHNGLPLTHDGPDHVARIANFYQSLAEGHIVPRWAGNLNWGYGHPILMFLYPLPSYVAALFHAVGFSFVNSVKLVFAISYVASIILFFLWARYQWNTAGGFIGAVIYGFSPYRFVDLYVRGAIGEHVAFVFPPLILWGLLRLARGKSKWSFLFISFGSAGLILSHNAVSLMIFPLLALYLLYVWKTETKYNIHFVLTALASIFLGFIMSSFFWIPAFLEGKYTLRDIVTSGELSGRFVPAINFVNSPWNYGGGNEFSKSLGLLSWIIIFCSLYIIKKIKSINEKVFILVDLGIIFISIVLMTQYSQPIWDKLTILQKFQFPWRILTSVVFCLSVLGAVIASHVPKKYIFLATAGTVILSLLTTWYMWHPQSYVEHPESYYSGTYNGTTDTGESSPIWSTRFMEHRPGYMAGVILGVAEIEPIERLTTSHTYNVNAHEKTRIVENTLYFPGWNVYVDGKRIPVEFQDPSYRGLITYWVNPGRHAVKIEFTETKLRQFADILSVFGLAITLGLSTISLWKIK